MSLQKVISKKAKKKIIIVVGILKVTDEKSKIRILIRSVNQRYGSAYPDPDLDPYQNVTDPEY
jgi:hypothetical protein